MRRGVALLLGVMLIAFAVRYFGGTSAKVPDSEAPAERSMRVEKDAPNALSASTPKTASSPQTISVSVSVKSRAPESSATPESTEASSKSRIIDLAPSVEEYRADAAKNPHEPPKALLRFAAELAPKFDEAIESPEKAPAFLDELSECLKSDQVKRLLPVQAICLANVRRLGEKLPSLESRAKEVWDQADPKLKKLVP